MTPGIDYYLAPQSPWTYLGHQRLMAMAQAAGASVRVLPIDLGRVFPVSGGLPLGRRAPQRQAYRLVELQRFASHLGIELVPQPQFFPVAADDAARLIIATDQAHGSADALRLVGAILAAVWSQQRNIADHDTLAQLVQEQGLAADLLGQAHGPTARQQYDANTQEAIDAGVFGAPTYRIAGELFWGQDRLDFVERRLARGV